MMLAHLIMMLGVRLFQTGLYRLSLVIIVVVIMKYQHAASEFGNVHALN